MEEVSTTEKRKFELTGSQLKWIAIILMFLNHFTYGLYAISGIQNIFTTEIHWYLTRASFLIFAFLISEGMHYTHDRKKYIFSLFAFAIISEIPYDLLRVQQVFDLKNQNVFFTLALGALTIVGIDYFKEKPFFQIACIFIGCVVATFVRSDYDFMGIAIIASFYVFREVKWKQLLYTAIVFVVFCWLSFWHDYTVELGVSKIIAIIKSPWFWYDVGREATGIVAFPLLALYHGKKGKNINKWFFYSFYPGHLLLIWGILSLINLWVGR